MRKRISWRLRLYLKARLDEAQEDQEPGERRKGRRKYCSEESDGLD